jgi:hypothetical protein
MSARSRVRAAKESREDMDFAALEEEMNQAPKSFMHLLSEKRTISAHWMNTSSGVA